MSDKKIKWKKVRVQLDMPESTVRLLDAVRDRTEAVSRADVIRSALALYAKVTENPDHFYTVDEHGNLVKVLLVR